MSLNNQSPIDTLNEAVAIVFKELVQRYQKQGVVFTPDFFVHILDTADQADEDANTCPTCYRGWSTSAKEGSGATADAGVSYSTCDAFRTATAPHVNHTKPAAIRDAPIEGLIYMASEYKTIFKSLFTTQAKLSLNREVWAALNLGDHHIAVRDHGSPYTAPIVTLWDDDTGTHTRYRAFSTDRWYAIFWGEGFSGIARGLPEFESLVVGKTNARGKACNTCAKAEYHYLLSLYNADCGVVKSSQRIPAACDLIPVN